MEKKIQKQKKERESKQLSGGLKWKDTNNSIEFTFLNI